MNIIKNRTVRFVASGYLLWSLLWVCVGMVPAYKSYEYSNMILSTTGLPVTLTAYVVEPLLSNNLAFLVYLSLVGVLQWALFARYVKIDYIKAVLFGKNYMLLFFVASPLIAAFSLLLTFLFSVITDQLSPISATNFVGAIVIVIYSYFYSKLHSKLIVITPLIFVLTLTVLMYAFTYFIAPVSHSRENLYIFFDTMTEELVVSVFSIAYVIIFSMLFKRMKLKAVGAV